MAPTCQTTETRTFQFEECMDTIACERIEPELHSLLTESDGPVVLDLIGVKFISSAFLGLCVRAYQKTSERGFEVVNMAPTIRRVFKIAGLESMLNVR